MWFFSRSNGLKQFFKFACIPGADRGVLVVGWYGLAISPRRRAVNRQLCRKMSAVFRPGQHAIRFTITWSYLFSLAIPWCLFYPFMFWDWVKSAQRRWR
jgi:hypothetical protein